MIGFRQKGDFSKTKKYFNRLQRALDKGIFDRYGKEGVEALSAATPVDTGLTSKSWSYEIVKEKTSVSIVFKNSNVQNGIPIAIILQYGHATRNGGWVEGRDYINPAIQPIFDQLVKNAWGEVTRL
jgi:hypothetical protein